MDGLEEIDLGFDLQISNDRRLAGMEVVSGHFDKPHPSIPGHNMATLGLWQHDGTEPIKTDEDHHIPPRPYLDEGSMADKEQVGTHIQQEMMGNPLPDYDAALHREGKRHTARIKDAIVNMSTPSNARDTIRRKGFNNPLIATGDFVESTEYEVRPKQGEHL